MNTALYAVCGRERFGADVPDMRYAVVSELTLSNTMRTGGKFQPPTTLISLPAQSWFNLKLSPLEHTAVTKKHYLHDLVNCHITNIQSLNIIRPECTKKSNSFFLLFQQC